MSGLGLANEVIGEQLWDVIRSGLDAAIVHGLAPVELSLPDWSSLSDDQRSAWMTSPVYLSACGQLAYVAQEVYRGHVHG